jgi:hypothetical protein
MPIIERGTEDKKQVITIIKDGASFNIFSGDDQRQKKIAK